MPAHSPKAGSRYLTPTGAPVQVLEARDEVVVLQSLASDNRIRVSACYPLRPFDPEQAIWEARPNPYSPRSRKADASKSPAQAKPLAPLIDAMLLAGDMTMKGILRELRRKASAACRGRDPQANVRARMSYLRRKGLQPRLAAPE